MAQLNLYSTDASRRRGQSFGEQFISSAKVALNGGTVVGTPTIDFGATLNGTTDSIVYQLSGNEFNSPAITIVGIFWPDFADDGAGHTIYSSTADDYAIRKNTGDILAITLGNVTIANIAKSVWLPHWINGGRNVIAVIGRNADTDVILNDSVILSGDPSAWTPKPVTELYIGSLSGGSNKFKGKIDEIQVYKGALTPQEIADFGTQTTYNYRNKAIGDWPMLNAQDEPTQTLDVSRSLKPAVFTGDPTKQTKRGYLFDGNDYMLTAAGLVTSMSQITMICAIRFANSPANRTIFDFQKPDGTAAGGRIQYLPGSDQIWFSSGVIATAQSAKYTGIPQGQLLIIVGLYDGTNTCITINGVDGADAATPTVPASTAESIVSIGAKADGSSIVRNGEIIYQTMLYDFALSKMQVQDITGKIRRSINAV